MGASGPWPEDLPSGPGLIPFSVTIQWMAGRSRSQAFQALVPASKAWKALLQSFRNYPVIH